MSFRRIIFWAHLAVGVATGLVIFALALTGVLLTYEMQIKAAFDPSVAPSASQTQPLSADEILRIAKPAFPGKTATLNFYSDEGKPVSVSAGRHESKLINPYDGSFIESVSNPTEGSFGLMESIHRNLAMGFDSMGGDIVKISNVAFLFIILSGAYLWLPRKWKWPFLKQKIFFQKMPTAKARDFNWHHVFSFWVIIPLVAVVGSGAVLSYQWASNAVFAVAGLEAPQGRGQGKGMWAKSTGGGASDLPVAELVSFQSILDKAKGVESGWNTISIIVPNSDKAKTVDVLIDTGNGKQASAQQTITYDRETGAVASVKGPDEMATPAQSLRRYIRFLHTGEVYGVIGQTLAGIASLACLFLVWTGFALAWRRLISPLFRHKATPTLKARS
ncbi:PepSY-associated TM helix domain-containing protein [uncultured Cohaesibacter sp.]|uniref:PepSY-associated TM helix domain-containing protein n=1 Tax=uncultured Cohaesibacter sp. TaxID=1002546 RepID=UPI002AA68BFC|nr:PepSY-associated TM helix domain-containing protein [uncultured Cohaesibacter sp.]